MVGWHEVLQLYGESLFSSVCLFHLNGWFITIKEDISKTEREIFVHVYRNISYDDIYTVILKESGFEMPKGSV